MYIQKKVITKNHIFIEKCFSARCGKKNIPRGPNIKLSSEAQKRRNEHLKKKRIVWLICNNFEKGDWWITLTYRREVRPDEMSEAKKVIRTFIRSIRDRLKRQGIDFIYVAITERGKKGGVHHHLIVKNNFDVSMVIKLWKYGKVEIDDIWSVSLYELAEYFVKGDSEDSEKDYINCRKLIAPKVKYTVIKAKQWTADPKPQKGYDIIHLWNGYHDYSGFPYQDYVQVRRC